MVVVSGNTGSAPLIGPKVIGDHASDGSVWSAKGPRMRPTPEPDQSCVRSEADGRPMERKSTLTRWQGCLTEDRKSLG